MIHPQCWPRAPISKIRPCSSFNLTFSLLKRYCALDNLCQLLHDLHYMYFICACIALFLWICLFFHSNYFKCFSCYHLYGEIKLCIIISLPPPKELMFPLSVILVRLCLSTSSLKSCRPIFTTLGKLVDDYSLWLLHIQLDSISQSGIQEDFFQFCQIVRYGIFYISGQSTSSIQDPGSILTCVSHTAHVIIIGWTSVCLYCGRCYWRLNLSSNCLHCPMIPVFWGPNFSLEFQWEHPDVGVKCKGVGKNCNFRPISCYSS